MNEKMNIQDLIDSLAEKHGMSKKHAENFVKEFFQLIEQSLEKDKYVKIKGLGTFKLIDVDSRESVNVNTGERFEIQAYTKVSFTPEPALKDIINKPFSHFETVTLNDDTVLEDTLLEKDNEGDDDDTEDIAPHFEDEKQTSCTVDKQESNERFEDERNSGKDISSKVIVDSSNNINKQDTASVDFSEERTELNNNLSEKQAIDDNLQSPDRSNEKDLVTENVTNATFNGTGQANEASSIRYFIGIVVFVVLLCVGAVVFIYYPDLTDNFTPNPVEEKVAIKNEKPDDKNILTDSLITENRVEPLNADTVSKTLDVVSEPIKVVKESESLIPEKEQKKNDGVAFDFDSVSYAIDGTEATYVIKEGETLTKVALRFYGTKALWPYLVKYNPKVIKNPHNVPFGTTIKIPKLVKKQ